MMQLGVFMVILFAGASSIYLDNIPLVIRNLRVRLIPELPRCLGARLPPYGTETAGLERRRTGSVYAHCLAYNREWEEEHAHTAA